jgi:hypothetical protein
MQKGPGEIRALREHDQVAVSKWERARSGRMSGSSTSASGR